MKKAARDLVIGDRIKLGNQWRRVWSVEHHIPASDNEIDALVQAVAEAREYSFEKLTEAARDLAAACLSRAKYPEPYVLVRGGSATSIYEQRYVPDAEIDIRRSRAANSQDQPQ